MEIDLTTAEVRMTVIFPGSHIHTGGGPVRAVDVYQALVQLTAAMAQRNAAKAALDAQVANPGLLAEGPGRRVELEVDLADADARLFATQQLFLLVLLDDWPADRPPPPEYRIRQLPTGEKALVYRHYVFTVCDLSAKEFDEDYLIPGPCEWNMFIGDIEALMACV